MAWSCQGIAAYRGRWRSDYALIKGVSGFTPQALLNLGIANDEAHEIAVSEQIAGQVNVQIIFGAPTTRRPPGRGQEASSTVLKPAQAASRVV
jgi:hypothetical protein